MSELNLYKIPAVDNSLPDTVENPAQVSLGANGAVENSVNGGISEQQVRDIVGQNISTGLKEDQVRDIADSVVRNYDRMTEAKVRTIVNSMQKFLEGENIMMTGIQKSQNFYTGVSGWQIDAEGNAEFNDGTFRGTFNVGGTNITINNTEDIQTNLDTINTAGGGTLYLQNGTYTLTADISIPGGVTLEGVSRDGVIINCVSSYAVKIVGSNVYSTGTVTINNGATGLVGVGTTWTSAMVGRYVLLDGLWYEITAFVSTTSLTIATYEGVNLAGSAYVLASTNFNASIKKVTVTGATGSGVVVQYAMEPNLDDIYAVSCGTGIEMDYVVYPRILVTSNGNGVNLNMNFVNGFYINFCDFSNSTTGAGIIMTNCNNATYFNSTTSDNFGDGINLTSCTQIVMLSFDISGNGGQGIEFVSGCNDNQITDGMLNSNTSDGIKLTATSDRNTIVSTSVINNGGYGINIAASTCDNNQIIAPAFDSNTSGNINDLGTNTTVLPQGDTQIFTGNGTWTKPTGAKTVEIIIIGGGGGGGKYVAGNGGPGGGGGAINALTKSAALITPTVAVTIGAGGKGEDGTASVNGGNTTFGSYLTAGGGAKGVGSGNVVGIGGTASGGISGGAGGLGQSGGGLGGGGGGGAAGSAGAAGSGGVGGTGGAAGTTFTSLGAGGAGGNGSPTSDGTVGSIYGGGGGGGGDSKNGAAGAAGYAIIKTYF